MKNLLITAFIFISIYYSNGQEISNKLKKYHFSTEIGMGASRFNVIGADTEEYISSSFRIAGNISRNIYANRLFVESGIGIFYRAKSKKLLIEKNGYFYYYGKAPVILILELTGTRDHIAIELPLALKYILKTGNSINAGIMVKFWQNEKYIDMLANQTKLGFIAGVDQKLYAKLRIGLDVYLGLQNINHSLSLGATRPDIKTQSAFFSVIYDI